MSKRLTELSKEKTNLRKKIKMEKIKIRKNC